MYKIGAYKKFVPVTYDYDWRQTEYEMNKMKLYFEVSATDEEDARRYAEKILNNTVGGFDTNVTTDWYIFQVEEIDE